MDLMLCYDRVEVYPDTWSLTLQLFKIIRENKNPKFFSECLSWVITALEDFGVSQVKTKVCGPFVTQFDSKAHRRK